MRIGTHPSHRLFSDDTAFWSGLKQAIANSSGYQRWEMDLSSIELTDLSADDRVRRYLRETLETLAY
jgi:hypothetical protein